MVAATINPTSVALMRPTRSASSARNCSACGAGVGGKQLLGLIQRQHQRRRRAVLPGVGQPLRGRRAQPHQQLTDPVGVVQAGVFDLTQRGAAQLQRLARGVDGGGQTLVSGQRIALRAHDAQHQKAAVLALQPRDQPGPQKRRLAAARGAQHHKQRLLARHRPEDRIARSSSSPRTIAASRPKNTPASMSSNGSHPRYGARCGSSAGGHTKFSGPTPVPSIALRSRYSAAVLNRTGGPSSTAISRLGAVGEQVTALPFGGDVGIAEVLQPRAQDLLAQAFGGAVLGLALVRGFPASGQQTDHRFTAGVALKQLALPPRPRLQPRLRVDVEENLIGQLRSLLSQPPLQRHRRPVIAAGMTQKNPRHPTPLSRAAPSSQLSLTPPPSPRPDKPNSHPKKPDNPRPHKPPADTPDMSQKPALRYRDATSSTSCGSAPPPIAVPTATWSEGNHNPDTTTAFKIAGNRTSIPKPPWAVSQASVTGSACGDAWG